MSLWDWVAVLVGAEWLTKHKKRKRQKEIEELKIAKMKEELEILKKKNGNKNNEPKSNK